MDDPLFPGWRVWLRSDPGYTLTSRDWTDIEYFCRCAPRADTNPENDVVIREVQKTQNAWEAIEA